MIIFFNKNTGKIEGTIQGRVHNEQHLKMWIGEKEETLRIVVPWVESGWLDPVGNLVDKNAVDAVSPILAPDHPQAEIFFAIEKNQSEIYKYKIDLATGRLVLK